MSGGGETGALMRQFDWSASSLRHPSCWPQSLRSVVGLLINSKFPMFVAWGDELGFLYNDAYAEILGLKHPAALGARFCDVWPEIWSDIQPMIGAALAGESTYNENLELRIDRSGHQETAWFTFSYSPVRHEDGRVNGLFCAVSETTQSILADRRNTFRLGLEEKLRGVESPVEITRVAAESLGRVLGVARVGYGEIDDAGEHVIVAFDWTDGTVDSVAGRHRLDDFGPSIIGELKAGGIMSADDVANDARVGARAASFASITTRSVLAVPLIKGGRFTAMLFLHHPQPRRWTKEDIALASDVAERTWAAVERARAQAALASSEAVTRTQAEELARIYDAAPIGLCVLDRDLRYVRINDRLAEINGVAAAEHIGRAVGEVLPDLDATAIQTMRRVLDGEEVWGVEFVGTTPARPGVVRTWRENWLPLRDAGGTPIGVTVSAEEITEAKAIEVALHESEERFRNMADHAPVMMWVTDAQGRCIYLNRAWYDFTGQLADKALGMGWLEAVHPEDRAWSSERFLEANAAREPFRLEYRLLRNDGETRYAIDAASPRFDKNGAFLGYIGSVIDIHERKTAEQELERRVADALAERAILANIVEGTDALVQVIDTDFGCLAINKAAADELERINGVRPVVGGNILDVIARRPIQQQTLRSLWQRALAGAAFTELGELDESDENHRTYEMKFNPLRGPAGEVIGAYQFVYDVTERVREQRRLAEAERARREADALYRAYFENTPEALFVIGVEPDGRFVVEELNPAHEAGVGFPLEQVRGKSLDEFMPGPAAERILASYRLVVESRKIIQYREVFDLHGEPQHWDTSLLPMIGEDGAVTRILGSSRNVTAQVSAEDALRHSQKMEAMGQLTGGVAHDFNNLLTPIVGVLDLLQRKDYGGERERRLLAAAAQSADRAKILVQRLLAFARRQPLQTISVDVSQLVSGIADLITSTTGSSIRLAIDAPAGLPAAEVDPNQLEMALLNLAVNARDAMPDGGTLQISVQAETLSDSEPDLSAGDYIRVTVSDTGVGMDDATRARAIEPFYSTKGVGKGTGLGLSMVHGLTSQLGGTLRISSRVGQGTSIELWLPQTALEPKPAMEDDAIVEQAKGKGTVLLVDDEFLVRMSTADMLTELGYEVIETASAEQALEVVAKAIPFDMLVTDQMMPGMKGVELAATIRSSHPNMPVLIISGYAGSDGVDGSLPWLSKPFRIEDLSEILAEVDLRA